jgi:hypothetical protein
MTASTRFFSMFAAAAIFALVAYPVLTQAAQIVA